MDIAVEGELLEVGAVGEEAHIRKAFEGVAEDKGFCLFLGDFVLGKKGVSLFGRQALSASVGVESDNRSDHRPDGGASKVVKVVKEGQ